MSMKFSWTEETIRYFKNASRYTGFHKKVASIIAPYFEKERTLADIGCGLGLLDIELSGKVQHIDALDINEDAIVSLKKDIDELGIRNIDARVKNIDELGESMWDYILLSFFGKPDQQLLDILQRAKEKIVMISHGTLPVGDNRPNHKSLSDFLTNNNIEYTYKLIDLEFGQPFTSREDAKRYFEIYSYDNAYEKLFSITDSKEFSHFYPKSKSIAIFVVVPK